MNKNIITVNILAFCCLLLLNVTARAQQKTVNGTVTDGQSGETLPGVNILVKGTASGTSTDANGQYELSVESLQDTLVFSFVGYKTQQVSIDGRTTINITLETQAISGEEMVVVGYGTQEKENLTGSVASINGDDLANQPATQTSSALMGKVPGVTVMQNTGEPGRNNGTIRIRGIGTLGNNDPLVLVDGVEGDLDDVETNDIENISVLKDAAASAIYGSRASNGVILVTTKRARETLQVNYRAYGGVQRFTRKPNYVNGGEFMKYLNMARENQGGDPLYSQDEIQEWEANHVTNPDLYPNTDWIDEVFREPGFQMKQHLSVSGGSDKLKTLGSITYTDENGKIPNFGFKRYTARLNSDFDISKKLHLRLDLVGRQSKRTRASQGSFEVERGAFRIPPVYAAVYSDGSWGPGWPGTGNPVAYAEDGGLEEAKDNYFKGILSADYSPVKSLEFSLMYSPEITYGDFRNFERTITIYDIKTKEPQFTLPPQSNLTIRNSNSITNNFNFTTTVEQTLRENHNFTFLAGYENINFKTENNSAYRDQFALQDFQVLNAGSEENQRNSGTAAEYVLQSIFGRLNYNYDHKYLLEANLRYDGSSRFAKDNRYGLFPSFSIGWRLSEEPFLSDSDVISNLKLRSSWGQLGNQKIGNYPFASTVSLDQTFIANGSAIPGAAQTDLANKNITWESSQSTNFGIDLGLFEDKFNLTGEYFIRKTEDILLQLPIPMTIGLNAPYQNAGKVKNMGWDFSINYRNRIGQDFQYNVGFNLSDVKNEVVDLKGAGPFITGASIITEGEPINSIYGFNADGFFDSQDEIKNSASQPGTIAPGDLKYKDLNKDGAINSEDRTIIGDPFPRYTFGLNLSAKYKNFDFSAFFQGVGKRDVLLQGEATYAFFNAGSMQEWQKDFWRPENQNASYPRLLSQSDGNNFRSSDFWVYDASYLRLRNLQVGYTIPNTLLTKFSIQDLRVYFLGQNLFTAFDDMPPGWDPNSPNGNNGNNYPIMAYYSFGIDLKF